MYARVSSQGRSVPLDSLLHERNVLVDELEAVGDIGDGAHHDEVLLLDVHDLEHLRQQLAGVRQELLNLERRLDLTCVLHVM